MSIPDVPSHHVIIERGQHVAVPNGPIVDVNRRSAITSEVSLRDRIVRCVLAARFGRYLLLAARALIVRAVFQSVWRLDLRPRLFGVERLNGLVSRRDLLFRAIVEDDLLPWHKDDLPDRHAV